MADWNSKQASLDEETKLHRWQKIMALPENTQFWDLSTKKQYTRGMFVPVYKNEASQIVDTFKIKGTDERVHVPFLRLMGDYRRCSLTRY